jgi:hypothetical protein
MKNTQVSAPGRLSHRHAQNTDNEQINHSGIVPGNVLLAFSTE